MSIYMVTWKTAKIEGENNEGSFVAEYEINSVSEAAKASQYWKEYIEASYLGGLGGEVFITGVFKL